MKQILTGLYLLTSIFCYSQIDSSNLKYYSCTIYGRTKDSQYPMGTAFFIRENQNVYFISARHELYVCGNFGRLIPQYDTANVFSTKDKVHLLLPIPPINILCDIIQRDTDLIVMKLRNDETSYIKSALSNIKLDYPYLHGNIKIVGQGFDDLKGKNQITTPKIFTIEKDSFEIKKETILPNIGIDSIHNVILLKKKMNYLTLKGFSGSPVYIKDLKANKWIFIGVFNYIGVRGRDAKSAYLYVLKPKYIIERIKQLN